MLLYVQLIAQVTWPTQLGALHGQLNVVGKRIRQGL